MWIKIPFEKKQRAFELRAQGKSYNEIRIILDLKSKGTLSYWFKDLKLPLAAKKRLENKMRMAQERGLIRFNKTRTRRINIENKNIREGAAKEIPKLLEKDIFLISVALYWGEGYQSERNKKFQALVFSNSNPKMIVFFFRFLREILKVDEKKIKIIVNIYPGFNENKIVDFWSKIIKLPKEQFRVSRYISETSKFKRPKKFLPFGTVTVRINSRRLFYKIKGYIDGISRQAGL
mgnify:CR=1 FL=1